MSSPNASPSVRSSRRLVVNADDYGYFQAVSRGILAAADAGRVTATGVLANGLVFEGYAAALRERPEVDAGVHLNLTLGEPLTGPLRRRLGAGGGVFPGRSGLVRGMVRGTLPGDELVGELRAQVERCLEHGLTLRFVNGHEHVHMLPGLFARVQALAAEYGIPLVRCVTPEWRGVLGQGWGALARSAVLQALSTLQRRGGPCRGPELVGSGVSGWLTLDYLERRLPRLAAGRDYELMCHPGYRDAAEVRDPSLLAFHHWDEELALLTGPAFGALCERAGVTLTRFRDLP